MKKNKKNNNRIEIHKYKIIVILIIKITAVFLPSQFEVFEKKIQNEHFTSHFLKNMSILRHVFIPK